MELKAVERKQRQRAANITEEQEKQILEKYQTICDTVDGLITAQPDVKNLDEVDYWLREMQAWSATLAEFSARAESFFALAVMQAVEEIPEETWKRIGKSSTLTTQYVAGLYEGRFRAWQRLNNLKSVVKTVMDNCRTLIVTAREEKEMYKAGEARNSRNFPEDETGNPNIPKLQNPPPPPPLPPKQATIEY